MNLAGGCRCDALKYEISGEPKFQIHCQCVDCQKTTGAGHAAIMIFNHNDVTVTGSPKVFSYVADSGNTVSHHFCEKCGAPLFNLNSHYENAIYMMVGSMDDPSVFNPQRIVYSGSGHEWDHMDPELPGFQGMPQRT